MNQSMKSLLVASATLASASALAVDGMKVTGHVDAQYQWQKDTKNTFVLDEANLAIERTLGPGEVVLDLAVESVQTNASTALVVGSAKSQGYVGARFENGFKWRLGQWHLPFGYEVVHSHQNRFTANGLLAGALPTAALGLMGGYDFSDMLGLQVWFGNRRDSSLMPYASANPDLGFQITTKLDAISASVGGLFGRSNGASDWLLDVVLGMNFGALSTNLGLDLAKAGSAATGFGIGLTTGYEISPVLAAGLRVEFTKDISVASPGKVVGVTVGPQMKLSDSFSTKFDYTLTKVMDGGTGHGINLAAVHSF